MKRPISLALAALLALSPAKVLAAPPKPAYVTGSPVTGAIAKASGPQSLTTGDLSGDCSTSSSLAVICLKTNGINFGAFATGTDAANLTGTLNLARFGAQSANTLLAGPSSGSAANPTFRAMVAADIPSSIIAESKQSLSDVTTANVSSSAHGYAPKSPADATKFLNGAATPAYAQVKDSDLSVSDITTNNVSTSAHGFAPKLPNDATKYLDGTGSFTVPAGGGGGVTCETRTASSSAALFFTTAISSSYDVYKLYLVNLLPASGSNNLMARLSTNAGSSYDTGSNYDWDALFAASGASGHNAGHSSDSAFQIAGSNVANSTLGVVGEVMIYNPLSSTQNKGFVWDLTYFHDSLSTGIRIAGFGRYKSNTAVNALELYMSTGNIASGFAVLCPVPH